MPTHCVCSTVSPRLMPAAFAALSIGSSLASMVGPAGDDARQCWRGALYHDHTNEFVRDYPHYIGHLKQNMHAVIVARDPGFFPAPSPSGININMMPIVLGDDASIPPEFHGYLPLLHACPLAGELQGQVGYLTIHESVIPEDGTPQRRGGVHTDGGYEYQPPAGEDAAGSFTLPLGRMEWGAVAGDCFLPTAEWRGGVFLASNVAHSTRVWNARVAPAAIGAGGDLEPLRRALGPGLPLLANELCWLTDRTPHESLPLPAGTQRSFIRLVTGTLSAWFTHHSTANRLGIEAPAAVQRIAGNKFAS